MMLGGSRAVFYEFMIFNKRGQLVYFEDLIKNETIKIEEKIECDRDFRNKM